MSSDSSVAFSQFLFFGLSGNTAGLSVRYRPVRVEITVIWVGINEVFVLEGSTCSSWLSIFVLTFILDLQRKVIRRQFPGGHWTWPRSLKGVPPRRPDDVASSDLDNDYCIGAEGAAPVGYCVYRASCRTCCGVGGGYVQRQWVDPPAPHCCWCRGAYWSGGGDSHVGYWNPGPNSSSCCSHTGIHWSW